MKAALSPSRPATGSSKRPPYPARSARDDRAIGLAQLPRLDQAGPLRGRDGGSGDDEAAGGLLVESVDEEGPEAEIPLHRLDDGDSYSLSGLRGEARRLVQHEDLIVLVERGDHRGRI